VSDGRRRNQGSITGEAILWIAQVKSECLRPFDETVIIQWHGQRLGRLSRIERDRGGREAIVTLLYGGAIRSSYVNARTARGRRVIAHDGIGQAVAARLSAAIRTRAEVHRVAADDVHVEATAGRVVRRIGGRASDCRVANVEAGTRSLGAVDRHARLVVRGHWSRVVHDGCGCA